MPEEKDKEKGQSIKVTSGDDTSSVSRDVVEPTPSTQGLPAKGPEVKVLNVKDSSEGIERKDAVNADGTEDKAHSGGSDEVADGSDKPDVGEGNKESKEERKEDKKEKGGEGKKKPQKVKKKKEKKKHRKISIKAIPALLFPEHLGDIFMIFVILALALGAGAFWFLAWLPTNESAPVEPQESIQRFSEQELQEIIKILDAREEASKAPVNPPSRDPFRSSRLD